MRARIYAAGKLIGEAECMPLVTGGTSRPLRANDKITVVVIDDHTTPNERPVFLYGPLESA